MKKSLMKNKKGFKSYIIQLLYYYKLSNNLKDLYEDWSNIRHVIFFLLSIGLRKNKPQ